jgi:hypothetical protein
MAVLTYEIGKGIVGKGKMEKYQKHFATKVVKNLEKNCVKVVDNEDKDVSKFPKIEYNLPKEI